VAPKHERSSTLRSLTIAEIGDIPIRDDAPMCKCGHVKVLHTDLVEKSSDHEGPCALCGIHECTLFESV